MSDSPTTATEWRHAARTVLNRSAKFVLWWPPAAAALWLLCTVSFEGRYVWMAFTVVHRIGGAALPVIFLAAVREEVLGARRTIRHRSITHAIDQLGIDATFLRKPKQQEMAEYIGSQSRSAYILLVLGVLGLVSGACYASLITNSIETVAVAGPLCSGPLLVFLVREEKKLNDPQLVRDAHDDLILGRLVGDRSQLVGGLVLDEHVGARGGGELTIQAEAGGLAVHDEVVLDLDASAEGAAEHIEEAQHGSRRL